MNMVNIMITSVFVVNLLGAVSALLFLLETQHHAKCICHGETFLLLRVVPLF